MNLDLSALEKALDSLRRAVVRSAGSPEDSELRDAVIQRFEYTYELCWKMLKRRIELDSPNPAAVDAMSFKDLLRDGAERGLIGDVGKWMIYRDGRNITAHTYDEKKAAAVHRTAVEFLPDAAALLNSLRNRNE
jgi:nucleotidyltransferase substrate binding protein (TIGR01987 family)